MTWKIKQFSNPKLKDPILIEGLPGIGNVGKIAVDFIIDNLKAKKLLQIYSKTLPHSFFFNEENLIELPLIEIYYKRLKDKDLLLLSGDVQPLEETSCYEFCDTILDISEKYHSNEIITLGGIGLSNIPKDPRVFCTANNKDIMQKYRKKYKQMQNDAYAIIGPIVGVSGLLVGLAKERNIPAISLLTETYAHPAYIGIKSAKETLNVLNKTLNLNLNLENLDNEIEEIEQEFRKSEYLQKIQKIKRFKKSRRDISYIG